MAVNSQIAAMADGKNKGVILSATDGGVAGENAPVEPFQFLVGPTTTNQFNTGHFPLRAIGCLRTDDVRFGFNSSFLAADLDFIDSPSNPDDNSQASSGPPNDIRAELAILADMVGKDGRFFGCPLSVFGHADPVGNDDYNKALSGRRAIVIYAMLIAHGDIALAKKLWKQVADFEAWGKDHREMMQAFTGLPSGTSGDILMQVYMQKLCPPELVLDPKKDFLGRGADSHGKGDYQGCSEFNPLLIFSKEKQDEFDQAQQGTTEEDKNILNTRNDENAPNRRVLVLIFPKGSQVLPSKWPCPRASESIAGCKKRFFSDGEKRRSTHLPGVDRKFEDEHGTFACRFYQRVSNQSPCDRIMQLLRLRLYDAFGSALPFAPFAIAVGESQRFTGVNRADERGFITIALPVEGDPVTSITVRWGFKPLKGEAPVLLFSRNVFLVADDEQGDEVSIKKLRNLGYDSDDRVQNIIGFQLDYGALVDPFLAVTGELDDRTRKLLDDLYQQSADHLRETKLESGQGG
jgi:hypothetical protein